jgi:hypothetical protein
MRNCTHMPWIFFIYVLNPIFSTEKCKI